MGAKYYIVRHTKKRDFIYLNNGTFLAKNFAYFSIYQKYSSKSAAQRADLRLSRADEFFAAGDKRRTVGEFEVKRLPAWIW